MAPDGLGKTILRSKEVDGASLAIVIGKDGGLPLLLGRKRVIVGRHPLRHFLPAEHVCIELGKHSRLHMFELLLLDAQRVFVGEKMGHAEKGQNRWRIDAGDGNNGQGQRWLGPDPALSFGGAFHPHRAGGEQHGVDGREIIQFAAKRHHLCQKSKVSPSQSPIGPSWPGKEEQQGKEHEQGGDEAEHLGLGLKIGQRRKQNVAALGADIVH